MVTFVKKPGTVLDFAAERAEIARQRRELDEYERALIVIEKRQKRYAGQQTVQFEKLPEGLTPATRIAIASFGETEFTVRDIESFLERHAFKLPKVDPRGRIAMVLKALLDDEEIERTYEGSGRDPHRYRTKNHVAMPAGAS